MVSNIWCPVIGSDQVMGQFKSEFGPVRQSFLSNEHDVVAVVAVAVGAGVDADDRTFDVVHDVPYSDHKQVADAPDCNVDRNVVAEHRPDRKKVEELQKKCHELDHVFPLCFEKRVEQVLQSVSFVEVCERTYGQKN